MKEHCFQCGRNYKNEGLVKTMNDQAHTLGFCSPECMFRAEKREDKKRELKELMHNLTDAEIKNYLKGGK